MLTLVRMPDPERRAEQYPHQLSGGMRQRAMIALALACEPRVLVADEPTTALDVTIQAQILGLIRDLQQRLGTALVLITHDLGVVAEMADQVIVMYAGRRVEEASVEALFDCPLHPYTRALMQAAPAPRRRRRTPRRSSPTFPARCRRPGRCRAAAPSRRAARRRSRAAWTEEPPLAEKEAGHLAACWELPDAAR